MSAARERLPDVTRDRGESVRHEPSGLGGSISLRDNTEVYLRDIALSLRLIVDALEDKEGAR